ncbi:hypothetical protein YC2023_012760 [Brassica napus]
MRCRVVPEEEPSFGLLWRREGLEAQMSGGEVAHRGRETSLEIDFTEARGRGRSFRRGTEEETDQKTATAEMENSRQFEIRDEKTWASLSRGGKEMRYREEDEWLALKTETKETRERL